MSLSDIRVRATLKGTIFRGGGGGGVTSYDQLNDKPSINGFTIEGDLDGNDYGLANTTDLIITGYNTVPGESIYRLHDVTIDGRNYTVAYLPFEGTDGVDNGKVGLVPAPTAADANKFLAGDGTWKVIDTPDLSNYTWSLLASTTSTTTAAIPAGTKVLVLTASLGGAISFVAKEYVSNINKLIEISSISTVNIGYEYADTSGNHTNIAMSITNNIITIKSGYNTVTASVYTLS